MDEPPPKSLPLRVYVYANNIPTPTFPGVGELGPPSPFIGDAQGRKVISVTCNGTQCEPQTLSCSNSYGRGPFSYSWSRVGGSAPITIASPHSASTKISVSEHPSGSAWQSDGAIRCTVTASDGQSGYYDIPVKVWR